MQQQEDEVVVRRRRGEDHRKGSLKSRIFQLSKRRRKEKGSDAEENGGEHTKTPQVTAATPPLTSRTVQGVKSPLVPRSLQLTRIQPTPGYHVTGTPLRGDYDLSDGATKKQGNGQGVTHRGPVPERNGKQEIQEQSSHNGTKLSKPSKYTFSSGRDPTASLETSQEALSCEVTPIYAESTKKRTHGSSDATSETASAFLPPFCIPSSPEDERPSPPRVVLRTNVGKDQQPGHLLHSAISRHFRHLHCNRPPPHLQDTPSSAQLSSNLEQYITDLFHQLDPLNQGHVAREDFEALCEVLGITTVAQGRNSMEWLSSYKPRPHTPGSPLRMDRLGEAKYPGARAPNNGPPPSFLWTQGPKPFWELWSARKARRKQLNLSEFKERLLEQWAASHGYPVQEARRLLRSKALQGPPKISDQSLKANGQCSDNVEENGRRRLQILERVGRRRPPSSNVNQTNGNGPHRGKSTHTNDTENRNGKGIGQNGFANGNLPPQTTSSATRKLSGFFLRSRKEQLEQQMVGQNAQIADLKDVIEDLRSSLQLSDAQNLALQVALKRMAKAESQLPAAEKSHQYEAKVQKSEKQLENLISELKEMSQTRYPTLSSQNCSTSSSSQEHEHPQLATTQLYLSGVQKELRGIATRLSGSPSTTIKDLSLAEAFDALVEAQAEIEKMRFWKQRNNVALMSLLIHRSNLEAAEAALAATESSLKEKETELKEARLSLTDTTIRLNESERNINHLQENRWSKYQECSPQRYSHIRKSLLQELKAAKEVLISSLKNVHDLELESRKVPKLEAQIHHLENKIARRRSQFY